MILREVKKILDAEVLCGESLLDLKVKTCFACDLISEMLIYVNPSTLLITSLTNAHIIHTAQVMDAVAVVFVGGKKPDEAIIKNAELSNIPLFSTPHLIFECCGLLFGNGIKGDNKNSC
jgi:predicted transcriptional regulator